MINIAIDGHVGSGKSTLAKAIASELGYKVLDTGAVYRGIACHYLSKNLPEPTEELVTDFVKDIKVEIEFIDDKQHVVINDTDYTPWIRNEETSVMAAKVSPFPVVRRVVLELQRDFARKNNCVMEGRDIGTEVLPNADVKLFITAAEDVRAMRRFDQIKDKPNSPSYQVILEDLRDRDYKDTHRKVSPLKPAEDSVIIDTSNMNLEQTTKYCLDIIIKKTSKQ